jgi:methylase of polypeptide subunit release factors
MIPLMIPPAEAIAGVVNANEGAPMKVLDLAAGHGVFGITIARHNPKASIYAVDWAAVLDIARENATAAGVADRWHSIEGSAFEVEFGKGLRRSIDHQLPPPFRTIYDRNLDAQGACCLEARGA